MRTGFEHFRYIIDLNCWLFPERGRVNSGMVSAIGKIQEFSDDIIYVCTGTPERHKEMRSYIGDAPRLQEIIGNPDDVLWLLSLATLPLTPDGHHDHFITTVEDPEEVDLLPESFNGAIYHVRGETELGWVGLCEQLGMTGSAMPGDQVDHVCRIEPRGKFSSEVAEARDGLGLTPLKPNQS